jgi:succinate dehydrogenase/fumarate reductase-like Fe-S protein
MKAAMSTTLLIQRGAANEPRTVERFEVPFVSGQSVLDGLRYIRSHSDPTLAFRFSCINANACKECMMLIDGAVDYACTTRLHEGEMTLLPLPKKKLINDLVTEIAPPDERLKPQTK